MMKAVKRVVGEGVSGKHYDQILKMKQMKLM